MKKYVEVIESLANDLGIKSCGIEEDRITLLTDNNDLFKSGKLGTDLLAIVTEGSLHFILCNYKTSYSLNITNELDVLKGMKNIIDYLMVANIEKIQG